MSRGRPKGSKNDDTPLETQLALRKQEKELTAQKNKELAALERKYSKWIKEAKENIRKNRVLFNKAHNKARSRDIRPDIVYNLAARGLKVVDVADIIGCHPSTLSQNPELQQALTDGRHARKMVALDANIEQAMQGNDKALERELKMSGAYRPDAQVEINIGTEFKQTSDADLLKLLDDENVIDGEIINEPTTEIEDDLSEDTASD